MKTRIATSLGIAFVLVFGIVAVFAVMGPQEAQAQNTEAVSDIKVEAVPNSPNTVAKWTVEFMNGDPNDPGDALTGGAGNHVIMIEFEDDVQFPESLDPDDITITTNMVSNPGPTGNPGTVVANPLGVDIIKVSSFDGTSMSPNVPADETLVTLEIPDMVDSDEHEGAQGIAEGATVTVVFRQSAGIKNPTEAKANEVATSTILMCMGLLGDHDGNPATADTVDPDQLDPDCTYDDDGNSATPEVRRIPMLSGYNVQVATSSNPYFTKAGSGDTAVIPRRIALSDQDGPRGSTITVVGLGFRNSITATIWNDRNRNGARDGGEVDLGSALITGSDDFTTTITINNPPFTSTTTMNGINAVDGRNRTIIPGRPYSLPLSGSDQTMYDAREDIPNYKLESSIKVTPGTAAIGDRVQVTARDFVPNGNISRTGARISIGGVPVTEFESASVSRTGDATFEMTIPNGVASGTQNLVVRNGSSTIVNTGGARFNMVVSGAQLSVTPSMGLVPNQTVTLSGRGFSIGGLAEINVAGADATISGSGEDLDPRDGKLNEGKVVEVDNAGNWSSSFVIPVTDVTVTPGDQELSITDTEGRSGSVNLNMAERTLTLSPASSRVGTRVNIEGSGFPADNPSEGGDRTVTVEIQYSVTGDTRTVVTLTPDGSGNIRGWFTVPLNAGIPSTNAVRAVFDIPDTNVAVTTSAVHQVPRAGITLDKESGPAGTIVTVTGEGFKRYTSVEDIMFGTLAVGEGGYTDGVGSFTAEFLVPGANTGAQAVSVKVGETTASATFTVTEDALVAPVEPAAEPMPPADAFAALIANDNNLVRVWQFDASAQNEAPDFGWSLYDPRPLFADANTIEMVEGGKFYWINVQNEQTSVLGGKSRTL